MGVFILALIHILFLWQSVMSFDGLMCDPSIDVNDEHTGDSVLEETLVEIPLHRFDRHAIVSGLCTAAGPRQQILSSF